MNIISFLVSFFTTYSLCAAHIQTADFSKSFRIGKQNYIVKLSEESWNHIIQGDQRGGGHSWEHFKPQKAQHIVFDTLLNTYIVSQTNNQKKGDKLSDIILNIQNRRAVHFHTLFPENVLTKDFVVDALIDAFSASKANKTKELGKGVDNDFFYANDHHDFHVAGFFNQKTITKNKKKTIVLQVKTIFPDLEWFYRIKFLHQKTEALPLSRFLVLKKKNRIWRRYGANLDNNEDAKNAYWPNPIEDIAPRNTEDATLQPADYAVHLQAKEILEQKFAQNSELEILSFFFDNPNAPKAEELTDLLRILARHVPQFKFHLSPQQKSGSISRKVNLLKLQFKKQSPSLEMRRFFNLGKCEGFYDTEEVDPFSPLHFAEELIRQMLGAHTASMSGLEARTTDELFVVRISSKFARNLLSSMIGDGDLLDQVIKSGFIFEVESSTITGSCEYYLSLMSTRNITHEALRNEKQTYIPVLKMKGAPLDHLKVEFLRF